VEWGGVCCTGSLPPFFLLNIMKHSLRFREKNLSIEGAKEKKSPNI
jgi:hypothetical protein